MRRLCRTAKGLKNAGDDQISCQNAECHGSQHREREHYGYKKRVHIPSLTNRGLSLKAQYEMPYSPIPSMRFFTIYLR